LFPWGQYEEALRELLIKLPDPRMGAYGRAMFNLSEDEDICVKLGIVTDNRDLYDFSKRDFVLPEEQGFIFTIIPVVDLDKNPRNTKPDHWQEGDSEGNLVWDPFWGTKVEKNYGILRNGTDSPRWITVKKV
jgi:hypothetical protein